MDVTDRFVKPGYGTRFPIQNLKSKIQNPKWYQIVEDESRALKSLKKCLKIGHSSLAERL
jgi:hypothetical protein